MPLVSPASRAVSDGGRLRKGVLIGPARAQGSDVPALVEYTLIASELHCLGLGSERLHSQVVSMQRFRRSGQRRDYFDLR